MSQPYYGDQNQQQDPSRRQQSQSQAQAQTALNIAGQMSRGRQNYNPSANYNQNNEVIDQ